MIDHVFKRQMDHFWNRVGRHFARLGFTPNGVTLLSFVCVLLTSAAFAWHRNYFWFAASVGVFELLDNVDGAIARVTNGATRAGAFLDATTDRLKEIALFSATAHVSGAYLPAMLALSLGLSVSYNLARGQAEGARFENTAAPLFERMERIVILCVGAALTAWEPSIITWALWLLVAGNGLTAVQRMLLGFRELSR